MTDASLDVLLADAERVRAFGDPSLAHLASPLVLRNYARLAKETARQLPGPKVLDWGCGAGQMSYLLRGLGADVTSYDVRTTLADSRLVTTKRLRAVRGSHPYALPFRSRAFDAVVACGVLEHVPDPESSLDELHRVLVAGGRLFLYNLPQRWSYKELVIRRLHLGYAHDRRYTPGSITALLRRHRFRVVRSARGGLVPHLGTGLPAPLRSAMYRAAPVLVGTDGFLCRLPGLRTLAESLEIVAEVD